MAITLFYGNLNCSLFYMLLQLTTIDALNILHVYIYSSTIYKQFPNDNYKGCLVWLQMRKLSIKIQIKWMSVIMRNRLDFNNKKKYNTVQSAIKSQTHNTPIFGKLIYKKLFNEQMKK